MNICWSPDSGFFEFDGTVEELALMVELYGDFRECDLMHAVRAVSVGMKASMEEDDEDADV